MIKSLPLGSIRRDGGTQMRAEINMLIVADYAEAYRDGADMPPLVVFYDGSECWLADGFHRWLGAEKAGFDEIACNVRPGQRRDAVLHACGANATHGLQRTNVDKRLAVETILRDEEWWKKSDNWIASKCGVSHPFVAKVRYTLESTCNGFKSAQRQGADGRTIDTTNIGKSKSAPLPDQAALFDEPEDESEPTEEEADETAPDEDDADDELASEGDPADPEAPDDEPEDELPVPESRPAQPARVNGNPPTVSPLHTKFCASLDDFDDFTRAVAAPRHYAGYGGFPEVFARIPPDDVRTVIGMIRMLHERLGGWLSHSQEFIND